MARLARAGGDDRAPRGTPGPGASEVRWVWAVVWLNLCIALSLARNLDYLGLPLGDLVQLASAAAAVLRR